MECILTVAVPTYNMAWCLKKNLHTYARESLNGKLEVIVLNNASEDSSKEIAGKFCAEYPHIFVLVDRNNRGYGSSVNEAIALAKGKYFRIVDADDWVDPEELERFIEQLAECQADIVQTDFTIENMQSKASVPVSAGKNDVEYGRVYTDFSQAIQTLPSIHSTTYRTELLRRSGFYMQDKVFFVDEEYITIPFLYAKDLIYFRTNVYHYLVQNPTQSTSPKNRGRYADHREKILRRLIGIYQEEKDRETSRETLALDYFFERIRRGVADHFTTLYIYLPNRRKGRRMAKDWKAYIISADEELLCEQKRRVLLMLNLLHVNPAHYVFLKNTIIKHKAL